MQAWMLRVSTGLPAILPAMTTCNMPLCNEQGHEDVATPLSDLTKLLAHVTRSVHTRHDGAILLPRRFVAAGSQGDPVKHPSLAVSHSCSLFTNVHGHIKLGPKGKCQRSDRRGRCELGTPPPPGWYCKEARRTDSGSRKRCQPHPCSELG